jgi:hypothetical protein
MSLRVKHVTFNCADPAGLAAFWAEAAGGRVIDDWGEFVVVDATSLGLPCLAFQRVPEPKTGRNRVHLDLHTGDRAGEVARLELLGAKVVEEHSMPGLSWSVLADPEGNEFCVAEE